MFVSCPSHRLFKFLVVHENAYDNEAIMALAARYDRFCPGPGYLDGLREELKPPKPFRPKSKRHKASRAFLREHRLGPFFDDSKDSNVAWHILDEPRLRETCEVNITVGTPWKSSTFALKSRYGFECSEGAVKHFAHMFFDPLLVSVAELRSIMYMQAEQQKERTGMPTHMDPRLTASQLPRTPLAIVLASIRMGIPIPKGMDFVKALKSARDAAALRFLEATLVAGPRSARQAADWAAAIRVVNEVLDQSTQPDDELRQALQRIKLETTKLETRTIDEITGGNYSDGSFVVKA